MGRGPEMGTLGCILSQVSLVCEIWVLPLGNVLRMVPTAANLRQLVLGAGNQKYSEVSHRKIFLEPV